jgi:hypothetical protein
MLGPVRALAVVGIVAALAPRMAWADDDVAWSRPKPGYVNLVASSFVGDGLRFNNPYRLATVLGSDAQSLSRTATYVEVGATMLFGDPLGFQQGATLRLTTSIEGVSQTLLTPSYVLWRRWRSLAAYAHAGIPLVLTPDVTWGFEGAVGGAWFVRGGIAIAAEIVGDVFYGTATPDVSTPAYPVLSGQIGLLFAYEAFP